MLSTSRSHFRLKSATSSHRKHSASHSNFHQKQKEHSPVEIPYEKQEVTETERYLREKKDRQQRARDTVSA